MQKKRILTFLNPEQDPLGSGYHIAQSKIAIGSGGFLGKGYIQGSQSHLEFIPEMHTDFVFSIFFRRIWFLRLYNFDFYLFLCYVMGFIAHAKSTYSRLIIAGLTVNIFIILLLISNCNRINTSRRGFLYLWCLMEEAQC